MTPSARYCQCGKLAGHGSVCALGPDDGDRDAERVDRGWEEQNARNREARHRKREHASMAAREQQRAGMTALDLHRSAMERAARLSTVKAGNVEPGRGGGDGVGPPAQQTMDDDPRWREHLLIVRSRLERMHALLDEAEGHGTAQQLAAQMDGSEKDRLILAEEGLSPLAVVEKLGRLIAGSPETVRRVRRAAGRSARDGARTEEKPNTAGWRRVQIGAR